MRVLLPLLVFLLSACEDGMQNFDPKEFLDNLDGPKVTTVNDTLLDNAKAAEKQGDYGRAAQFYEQVLAKSPEDKEVAVSLAESYRRSGKIDAALSLYDQVLLSDAKHVRALEGKGLALMVKGDFETPGSLFSEVLTIDATRWKTLNALGILFSTRGMQHEAQAYYLEALKYAPSNTSVLNNLGLSQALNKSFDEAIASLSQASTISAINSVDRKRIDLNLSLVYATAGKLPEARAIAEQYFEGAALNNNLGLYAHLAKDDQLARSYLNMALTESKIFYEKAWDNLQSINEGGTPMQSLPDSAAADEATLSVDPIPAPATTPAPAKMPPVETPVDESKAKSVKVPAKKATKPVTEKKPEPKKEEVKAAPKPEAKKPEEVKPAAKEPKTEAKPATEKQADQGDMAKPIELEKIDEIGNIVGASD